MKKSLIVIFTLLPYLLSALTLNPSTFTVSNISDIPNGTTVYLDSGNYVMTQEILDAWEAGVYGKSNITFTDNGNGTVVFDGMSFAEQQEVRFENGNNLRIENITLKNIKLTWWRCKNSTFDNITSREQKFVLPAGENDKDYGKRQSLLAIGYGDNCTISNCTLEITFSDFSCKVIKSYRGTNHKFINNTITGNLQSGYEIFSNVGQVTNGIEGYSGAVVKGGYIERTIHTGSEDHGIYFHDVSDALIDSVTIKGWSPNGAGGAVKIKNSNNVEVKNCTFYTSGVLLRTGSSGWQHCRNIYIHNNDIHGGLALSTYMTPNAGYDNPEAIVFENNRLYDDGISMSYNSMKFNQYSSRAGKPGGIYNNGYANGESLAISSGVNLIGNYIIGSNQDPENGGSVPCSPSVISPYLKVNKGSWHRLSSITVNEGDTLSFSPQPTYGTFSWTGPGGYNSTDSIVVLENIQSAQAGDYKVVFTNICGESSSAVYRVTVPGGETSIAKVNNSHLRIYPNPFSSSLTIIPGKNNFKRIVLSDLTGRIIIRKDLEQETELNICPSYSIVPAGIYYLHLISDDEHRTIKVLRN